MADFREPPEDNDQVSLTDFLAVMDHMGTEVDSEEDSDYEDHGEREIASDEEEDEELGDADEEELEGEIGLLTAEDITYINIYPAN